jgi:hypothetical protein
MFKIKQDNCSTDLHADLDLVDIPTHLKNEYNAILIEEFIRI